MKLNDVIDIEGKLYQITHISMDGSFEAEPIGEVVAKGFIRKESQSDDELKDKLYTFCDNKGSCWSCPLQKHLNCFFNEYSSEQLKEAYNIIKEDNNESID